MSEQPKTNRLEQSFSATKASYLITISDELRRDHQWLWTGAEWAEYAADLRGEIASLVVDRIEESNPWKRGWITRRINETTRSRDFASLAAEKGGVSFAEWAGFK